MVTGHKIGYWTQNDSKLVIGLKMITRLKTDHWTQNDHWTQSWTVDVTLVTRHETNQWTRILHNLKIFIELPLRVSKSSQNKPKLFSINSNT